ncbi:MAG: HNH endonuclease, partial [Dermatophilaceae bacterium]
RHIDHTIPHRQGGPTSYPNGRGVCAACNHAKEAPGWTAAVTDTTLTEHDPTEDTAAPATRRREVTLTTPTGHTYTSHPPPARPPRQETERADTSAGAGALGQAG